MVGKCCIVDGCYSSTKTSPAISFHPLPVKDPKRMEEWKSVVSISRLAGFICSEHFESSCFTYHPTRGWLLRREAVPVTAIPARWISKKQIFSNLNKKEEAETVVNRRLDSKILHWRNVANERKNVEGTLQKKRGKRTENRVRKTMADENSDAERESAPWWFKRDISKESIESFWEDMDDVWRTPWPDEMLMLNSERNDRHNTAVTGKLTTLNSSLTTEDATNCVGSTKQTSGIREHPGATDVIDDTLVEDSPCDKSTSSVTNCENEHQSKDIRILSIKMNSLESWPKITIRPVLNFCIDKKGIFQKPAHKYFPKIIPQSDQQTCVADIGVISGMNYVDKLFNLTNNNSNGVRRQKGNNKSLKITLDKEILANRRCKVEELYSKSEIATYQRQVRHVKMAIRKAMSILKRKDPNGKM